MMRQVGFASASEIVDDAHLESALDKKINHVAADKPGAAGDDCDRQLGPARLHGTLISQRARPRLPERFGDQNDGRLL